MIIKPKSIKTLVVMLCISLPALHALSQSRTYTWIKQYDQAQAIANRIPAPDGYERVKAAAGSFEDWLRHLPLKKGRPPVYLYNGALKGNQSAHYAVVDMDVGKRDLQQCADAIMRLRAEYFYSTGNYDAIHFKFTSGHNAAYSKWREGYRPRVRGSRVRWVKSAKRDTSYSSFRRYLNIVFSYAGSYSLSKELHAVDDIVKMKIGNIFIQGGFPGHAVIVADMAVEKSSGKKIFLLLQSYMPAQEVHVLKNPNDSNLSPWYKLDFGNTLHTPEWVFKKNDLKRF